jgi:hypothetical protein
MLKEAETIYMYAQGREDDAQRCVGLYSLPTNMLEALMSLPVGVSLLKIGSAAPLMLQHLRSVLEVQLTDTNAAMHARQLLGEAV